MDLRTLLAFNMNRWFDLRINKTRRGWRGPVACCTPSLRMMKFRKRSQPWKSASEYVHVFCCLRQWKQGTFKTNGPLFASFQEIDEINYRLACEHVKNLLVKRRDNGTNVRMISPQKNIEQGIVGTQARSLQARKWSWNWRVQKNALLEANVMFQSIWSVHSYWTKSMMETAKHTLLLWQRDAILCTAASDMFQSSLTPSFSNDLWRKKKKEYAKTTHGNFTSLKLTTKFSGKKLCRIYSGRNAKAIAKRSWLRQ